MAYLSLFLDIYFFIEGTLRKSWEGPLILSVDHISAEAYRGEMRCDVVNEEIERFVAELLEFVENYRIMFDKDVPLIYLNRRYGPKAKKTSGLSLKVLLESDERFFIKIDEKCRSLVLVAPKVATF